MGLRGVMGEKGTPSSSLTPSISSAPPTLSALYTPSTPSVPFDIEKIPFYPLNRNLPPIIQLKLRAKELNYLLNQLQKSLENKMNQEKKLSSGDAARKCLQAQKQNQKLGDDLLEQYGFEKLENGQVVEKINENNGLD